LDKRASEWKFSSLDIDQNGTLTKMEYRDLNRMVRKVAKPKRCSRTFIRTCDTDHNSVLSKIEWSNCLSIDGKPSFKENNIMLCVSYIYTSPFFPVDNFFLLIFLIMLFDNYSFIKKPKLLYYIVMYIVYV